MLLCFQGNETYRVSKEGEPGKDGAGNSMSSKNFSASNSKDQDDLSKSVVGSGSGQKPPDDKSKPGSVRFHCLYSEASNLKMINRRLFRTNKHKRIQSNL